MNITSLGIDLVKNVFQLHGVEAQGKVMLKKKTNCLALDYLITQLPKCLIGMESCGGGHYWARKFQLFGHIVRLISPQFVKPYVICCVFYVLLLYIINQPFAYFLLQYKISKLYKLII